MSCFTWTLAQLLLCWVALTQATAVSFYGTSYIHVPIQDGYLQTNLELRFKTPRPQGLLLLVSGDRDFFLVQLHSGTVQLHIKLGSEDTVLKIKDARFDDLSWHKLTVTADADEVHLTVDEKFSARKRLKGQLRELNAGFGVFLGGTNSATDDLFDNELKKFRGCLSNVTFSEVDILALATGLTDPGRVVEVSWDEDEIFSAIRDDAISFQSDTSYISFSHFNLREDKTVSFQIQTTTGTALVLFSSSVFKGQQDYIALQLLDGYLKFTANKNDETVSITSKKTVNSGKWHLVDVALSVSGVELVVDGDGDTAGFEDISRSVQLGGQVYMGGINHRMRAVVNRQPGLDSVQGNNEMKGSIRGCMRNIVIDSRVFSIHDIHISRLIGAGCNEKVCESENCDTDNNCAPGEDCQTADLSEVAPSSDSSNDEFQLLSVRSLAVEEGGAAVIHRNNIEIIYNYRQYNIRESGIQIHVIKSPEYGTLDTYLGRRRQSTVFTYLDLIGNKVKYIHDGSEEPYDYISMEIEFYGSNNDVPPVLQRKHAFVLPINITGRNDPPRIVLGNGGMLRIISNTKIRISNDIIYADDPDTSPSDLTYIVRYHSKKGYFEKVGRIGVTIWEFTQQEINDRQIWFLHHGSGSSTVRLQVTDGVSSSQPAELRIQTVQLQLDVIKNTGLVMPHGTSRIISNFNLSTSSNVPTQELEIRYEINQAPVHGLIERQQYTDSEWKEVNVFAQRHIDSGHIRYRQYNPSATPDYDQFEFHVKAKRYTTPRFTFRIQFEQVYVSVKTNNKLQLFHQYHEKITVDNLEAVTNNPQIGKDAIRFVMLRATNFGDFYKVDPRHRGFIDFSQIQPLSKESTFTQADINNGAIVYKLRGDLYDKVQDFADLQVEALRAQVKMVRFWIEFIPMKSDIRFINNGLYDVLEGDQKLIHKQDLYIETDKYREFSFTVIQFPQHGELILEDSRTSAIQRSNVSDFTNSDIATGSLLYRHDDSENDVDSFTFLAVPIKSNTPALSEIPEFTGTFDIHMRMRNDNPPVRLVDKVFHIVTNKERLITTDDLAFTDPDIDYDPGDLQFTRRGIANGEILNATDKTAVYQFTQRDLENKQIVFRHRGEAFGRAVIYVTDGQFYETSLFEVQAGDPFIRITMNTGAMVKSNSEVAISTQNLSVEANVNADEITFVLIEEPKWGYLRIRGEETLDFTFMDLQQGELYYQHAGGNSVEDYFKFAVFAGDTQTQDQFFIQIFMESAEQPPRVINNKVLEVFGNEQGMINQSHLLITHPDSTADNIEYLVLVLPQQGRLFRGDDPITMEDMTFTQQHINDGFLGYQIINTSATSDQFIFEVTNGFQTLRGLEFLIEVIPSVIPLQVKNFTVREGGRKALTPNHLKLKGRYFEGRSAVFRIVTSPQHGIIEFVSNRGNAIFSFTSEDLVQGRVYYSHDDSEELSDLFSVQASLEGQGKESEVEDIHVVIEGINDEGPQVLVNQGLTVWNNSMTQLTPNILRADDPDTPPEQILYRISSPSNGHLSLLNNTYKQIDTFSQALINEGAVVFVHKGAAEGSFSFQVTDGYHSDSLRNFRITAKPLILTLDMNEVISAYPNLVQPITAQHLSSSTNDPQQSKPIIYTLTSKPDHGSVVTMVKGRSLEVTSFTQEEINSGEIFYEHEGQQFSGLTQNDSFTFAVTTLYAEPLEDNLCEIFVSYGNLNSENKNQLIKITGIRVDEGKEMVIGRENLDVTEFVHNLERLGNRVSLTFSLKDSPRHGVLKYRGRPALRKARFTQRDVNHHFLRYEHDDSDTIFDSFNLTLHLRIDNPSIGDTNQDQETRFPLTLNITIQPVNDEEFQLVTRHPVIEVIQGFTVQINSSALKTVDKDTEPAYLQYTVLNSPSHGILSFGDGQRIRTFTQEDIDVGRVVYQHDGSNDVSDSFNFYVTDGVFPDYHREFHIRVIKINMNLRNSSAVLLKQSETSVYIMQENMNVTTNGRRDNVTYIIRDPPKFGYIYVWEYNVTRFSQTDVDSKRVLYLQTDLSSGYDYFVCDVVYSKTDIAYVNHRINIKVEPLVKMEPLEAPIGKRVAITILNLDAGRLSEVTGDIPVYRVTKGPYFGRIVKKTVVKRQVHHQSYLHSEASTERSTTEFSHEDVVYMKVYYEGETRYNHQEGTKDNFTFQLNAYNVQPAEGVFYIGLAPSDTVPMIPVSPTTKRPWRPEPTTIGVNTQSPDISDTIGDSSPKNDGSIQPSNVKNDHVLVLAILIPLLLLLIIVVLVVFFIWRHRRKRDYSPPAKKSPRMRPTISGPLQIEQPHVHIEPQAERSPLSEDSKSIAEYQNTSDMRHYTNGERGNSEETDVMTPMIRHDIPSAPRSPDTAPVELLNPVSDVDLCAVLDKIKPLATPLSEY